MYVDRITEEKYRVLILGCRRRGRKRDGAFDHATGKGWVAAKKGAYHDALTKKRSRVVPAVVESTGGQCPALRAQMRRLEGRAKGAGASDRTSYGRTRASARSSRPAATSLSPASSSAARTLARPRSASPSTLATRVSSSSSQGARRARGTVLGVISFLLVTSDCERAGD